MAGAAGLEPATLGLEGRCSIHLSYAPVAFFLTLPRLSEVHLSSEQGFGRCVAAEQRSAHRKFVIAVQTLKCLFARLIGLSNANHERDAIPPDTSTESVTPTQPVGSCFVPPTPTAYVTNGGTNG